MEDLEKVILHLAARFKRMPTDNEVYRFIWGGKELRQKIWDEKGLPEHKRIIRYEDKENNGGQVSGS